MKSDEPGLVGTGGTTPAELPPVIQVDRLSYRYPNGVRALEDVSLEIRSGEIVGLVGPSGAGKSTLLMHLNGLLPEKEPDSAAGNGHGVVRLAGRAVLGTNLPEVRRMVGFLFQDPDDQLFCPTVREDVAFGPLNLGLPKEQVLERIAASLESVGLSGYDDRSTLQLSVGERKRVCLAGVLACEPVVLALDEPFSNLDPRARRGLIGILRRFEGAQVIATHDLDVIVELCTRVVVLDGGQIRADGRPDEVLADERLMERHGLEVPLRLRYAS